MDYTTVNKDEMLVIGIALRTTNENNQAAEEMPKAWDRFYSSNTLERIPNRKSDEVLGAYVEYEGDHTKPYTLIIGCEVNNADEVPEGLVVKKIPAAKYAAFKVSGKFPDSLIEAWQKVWASGLKRSYSGD